MFGSVLIVGISLLVVAGLVFAPLGYFIYMYTKKGGDPFGETEPHGDSESLVLDLAESLINKIKGYKK